MLECLLFISSDFLEGVEKLAERSHISLRKLSPEKQNPNHLGVGAADSEITFCSDKSLIVNVLELITLLFLK